MAFHAHRIRRFPKKKKKKEKKTIAPSENDAPRITIGEEPLPLAGALARRTVHVLIKWLRRDEISVDLRRLRCYARLYTASDEIR